MSNNVLYFEVLRMKQHFFLDAKENETVRDLKMKLQAIIKVDLFNMQLFSIDSEGKQSPINDVVTMTECGFNVSNAKSQMPAKLGLRILDKDEELTITDVSSPPPLPDVDVKKEEIDDYDLYDVHYNGQDQNEAPAQ